MEHCRAAERALVAALVMGQVEPADLAGRLHPLDFTDPAAGACFAAALDQPSRGAMLDLPDRLRQRAELRSDGYPIRELLDWLPSLPVPAHPEAWAALVVAGSMGRVVHACGTRLVQATISPDGGRPGAGRVLTLAAAQRATLHGAVRRWDGLPASWRDTLPARALAPAPCTRGQNRSGPADPADRLLEREVLAGLVAAPVLFDQIPWLRTEDFTDPGVAEVYHAARQLHDAGRPVDLVTLSAHVTTAGEAGAIIPSFSGSTRSDRSAGAAVCTELRPEHVLLPTVPFLARRIVEDAAVREAAFTGEDLVALAAAPGTVGGLGRPLLDAALQRLDGLRPHAERLEQAHHPITGRGQDVQRRDQWPLPADSHRLAGARTVDADRHAS